MEGHSQRRRMSIAGIAGNDRSSTPELTRAQKKEYGESLNSQCTTTATSPVNSKLSPLISPVSHCSEERKRKVLESIQKSGMKSPSTPTIGGVGRGAYRESIESHNSMDESYVTANDHNDHNYSGFLIKSRCFSADKRISFAEGRKSLRSPSGSQSSAEIEQLRNKIAALEKENRDLKFSTAEHEEIVKTMQQKAIEVSEKLVFVEQQKKDAWEEVNAINFVNSIMDQKLTEVESELSANRMDSNEANREKLQKYKSKIKKMQKDKQEYEAGADAMIKQLTEQMTTLQSMAMKRIETLEQDLIAQRHSYETLQAEHENVTEQLEETVAELSNAKVQLEDKEASLRILRAAVGSSSRSAEKQKKTVIIMGGEEHESSRSRRSNASSNMEDGVSTMTGDDDGWDDDFVTEEGNNGSNKTPSKVKVVTMRDDEEEEEEDQQLGGTLKAEPKNERGGTLPKGGQAMIPASIFAAAVAKGAKYQLEKQELQKQQEQQDEKKSEEQNEVEAYTVPPPPPPATDDFEFVAHVGEDEDEDEVVVTPLQPAVSYSSSLSPKAKRKNRRSSACFSLAGDATAARDGMKKKANRRMSSFGGAAIGGSGALPLPGKMKKIVIGSNNDDDDDDDDDVDTEEEESENNTSINSVEETVVELDWSAA